MRDDVAAPHRRPPLSSRNLIPPVEHSIRGKTWACFWMRVVYINTWVLINSASRTVEIDKRNPLITTMLYIHSHVWPVWVYSAGVWGVFNELRAV